jgi:outer membrane lipopolysaccharide assembly protein LptE/RlpB
MNRVLLLSLTLLLTSCGFHLRQATSERTYLSGDDNTLTTTLQNMLGKTTATAPYHVTLSNYKIINQSANFLNTRTPSTEAASLTTNVTLFYRGKKINEKDFSITSTQLLNTDYSYHPHPQTIILQDMMTRLSHNIYYWIKASESKAG